MKVDFCLPAKNEEQILASNIKYLLKFLENQKLNYFWEIIIIINGSQDKSYLIAKELTENDSRIKIKYLELGGKGRALKEYFQESRADILVFMDIDLVVALDNITPLINPILNNEADLVMGSRLLPNSHTDRSIWRSFISHTYNILSRVILQHSFSDLQCGFKAFRREVFSDLQTKFKDNNWFFDTELIILAYCRGYKIKEIPVDWRENRHDVRKSKIKIFKDIWSFLKNLIYFKWRLINLKIDNKNISVKK